MSYKNRTNFDVFKILNIFFLVFSVAICSVLMLVRIPGMELLEINPNWLLVWLVSWSLGKPAGQGGIAGLIIGWIYDGIAGANPSHAIAFVVVGLCTSALPKQKYIGEDFISVAFIVFFMNILAETIFALIYSRTYFLTISEIWHKYQQISIVSAIITSLWSPIFYYPFNLCQRRFKQWEKRIRN